MIEYERAGEYVGDPDLARRLGMGDDPVGTEMCRRVRGFLSPRVNLAPEYIPPDRHFDELGVGGADSIDDLDFAIDLEAALGVKLSDEELDRIRMPAGRITVAEFLADVVRVARPKFEARDAH